ncbi:MAG TPA: hypothetical protein VLV85_18780 [Stellaceae bacterium]|jgi:hypothetical protein|nr:hypothetical protein [Stellaceae bacterium]
MSRRRRGADHLSAAEIAAAIARSRDRLSRDLALLDRDYALRHLAVRAVRLAQQPEIDVKQLGQALRRDAAPLALIGLGLGWIAVVGEPAGREWLGRLGGAVAALQRLAREFGLLPRAPEPPAPPLPEYRPDRLAPSS